MSKITLTTDRKGNVTNITLQCRNVALRVDNNGVSVIDRKDGTITVRQYSEMWDELEKVDNQYNDASIAHFIDMVSFYFTDWKSDYIRAIELQHPDLGLYEQLKGLML